MGDTEAQRKGRVPQSSDLRQTQSLPAPRNLQRAFVPLDTRASATEVPGRHSRRPSHPGCRRPARMDQEGECPGHSAQPTAPRSLGSTRHRNSEGAGACAHPRYLATATSPGEGTPPPAGLSQERPPSSSQAGRAAARGVGRGAGRGALGRVRSRSPGGLEA